MGLIIRVFFLTLFVLKLHLPLPIYLICTAFLTAILKGLNGDVWTGLSTVGQLGTPKDFVWDGGKPLDYTNWGSGQPDGNMVRKHWYNNWHFLMVTIHFKKEIAAADRRPSCFSTKGEHFGKRITQTVLCLSPGQSFNSVAHDSKT